MWLRVLGHRLNMHLLCSPLFCCLSFLALVSLGRIGFCCSDCQLCCISASSRCRVDGLIHTPAATQCRRLQATFFSRLGAGVCEKVFNWAACSKICVLAAVSLLHRDGGLAIGRTVVLVHCIVSAMCCCFTEGRCTSASLGINVLCAWFCCCP
jgi:hypothetical protein